MPHYDYQCEKCGHIFEEFQTITEKHIEKCPECQGKVKRLIGGGAGIIFKGSGFYKTDYRKSAPSSLPCRSGSEGKGEAKSDSSAKCASCPAAQASGAGK